MMKYIIESSTCDWSYEKDGPVRYRNKREFNNWEEAVKEFILDYEAKDPAWLDGLEDVDGEVHLYDEYGSCLDEFAFSEEDILKDIIYNEWGLDGEEAKEEFELYFNPMPKSKREALLLYRQLPKYKDMVNKDLGRKEDDRIVRAYWKLIEKLSPNTVKNLLRVCATQDVDKLNMSGQVMKDIADSMLNRMSEKQLNIAYSICANVIQTSGVK